MKMKCLPLLCCSLVLATGNAAEPLDLLSSNSYETIALSGKCDLALSSAESLGNQPFHSALSFDYSVSLPGTLAENKKGTLNVDRDQTHYLYIHARVSPCTGESPTEFLNSKRKPR